MISRYGALALVGRPNTGKSTLINRLTGAKVSIVSSKAQTTRHRIRGILTRRVGEVQCQFVFVDTPGYQQRYPNALNRAMNRNVGLALEEVDAVLMLVETGRWQAEEDALLTRLPPHLPLVLAINKIDRLAERNRLLPFIAEVAAKRELTAVVPISAESGEGLEALLGALAPLLPEGPPHFSEDEFTDSTERFLAKELLREQLFRHLGEELPYGLAVDIEQFQTQDSVRCIHAAILVDKPAHKAIIIGKGGSHLKRMASLARRNMEQIFGGKVWLECWVKVKNGWADDERLLRSLGYSE